MPSNVFTIPPTLPFADTLAAGLLARADGVAEALARTTVLLPTRRACRALREAFLRQSGGRPLLLPRLRPIGDVDEEELVLTAGEYEAGGALADVPPAIPSLRRRLLLAELIRTFEASRGSDVTPDQAAWLAADLARLLDEMQTERRDAAGLAALVPERFATHWQDTLKFLGILTGAWPKILAAEGALDPAAHRNRLLEAQAAAWRAKPPADPVIAAGSTGSIPATADLIATIAALPQGLIVLPGLDTNLEDAAWNDVREAPSHPQHGLARLLERLGLERADVAPWGEAGAEREDLDPPFVAEARLRVLSAALRPAGAPARRPGEGLSAEAVSRAFADSVAYLECANPREEAGAIALRLREALDDPGATAALVTPDRDLARRVAAALQRWRIEIDDSAGTPLAAAPPMAFLRLVLAAAHEEFAPVPLLALLKHPLAACGMAPGALRARARVLERAALRGPRPPPGLDAAQRLAKGRAAWLDDLARRMAPLTGALAAPSQPAEALLRAHIAAAEALAAAADGDGAARLWAGEAGEAAARFLDELAPALRAMAPIRPADYPELLEALLGGAVVRPRYGTHPRLAILGPLEARLQRFDLMILGSLNEGVWPAAIAADPWMSRPMRKEFGLPLAERRIGLSAHDFVQAAMAPRVLLTRSLRQNGQPTRPSRWLLRIEAELEGLGLFAAGSPYKLAAWRSEHYQRIARAIDTEPPRPAARPAPCPPPEARPRRISVTQVELWRRNPYAIYARHILGLVPLDALDADPSAADLGTALHQALAAFVNRLTGKSLPADAYGLLMRDAEAALETLLDRPGVWAFWRPRFERIARWFVATEAERRAAGTLPLAIEKKGTLAIAAPLGTFTLSGTADRIDRRADGTLAVVDYKTGVIPRTEDVALGFAPQLALEAAMAESGAFGRFAGKVAALEYWRLAGRGGGEIKPVKADVAALIAEARAGFEALVALYDRAEKTYPASPRPARAARFDDYVQLARTQEWLGR
ncbi:MAG: double-strand break repair protein AddB [Alphaproteobacteria bacterium]